MIIYLSLSNSFDSVKDLDKVYSTIETFCKNGYLVICPKLHFMDSEISINQNIESKMLELLAMCDILCTVDYVNSSFEVDYAIENQIPVYTLDEILKYYQPFVDRELLLNAKTLLGRTTRLLQKKRLDYGPGNIAMTGEIGISVRLSDKISRLLNLLGFSFEVKESNFKPKDGSQVNFESIEDTWIDIINYGVIGYLVRNDKWS